MFLYTHLHQKTRKSKYNISIIQTLCRSTEAEPDAEAVYGVQQIEEVLGSVNS